MMCGLLAGLVIAVAALPMVGVTGLAAKAASDSFASLPSQLKSPPIPQTSMLYAADGTYITSFYHENENRVYTKLKDIPEVMRNAMIAAEDQRFPQHRGVDAQGVIRALLANKQAGTVRQGASTLTMQLVKNTLQYSAKTEEERKAASADTPARKLAEARYAIALEKQLPKGEILERYLNIAYFGNGSYSVFTAAQAYFSKEPKELTLTEAALIASLVKNPTEYNPLGAGNTKAKERRDYVLDQMASLNYASRSSVDAAKSKPLELKPKTTPRQCENAQRFGFYCGWFVEWVKQNEAFGKTRQEREDQLNRGGYRITLALDPKMQDAAQQAIDKQLPRGPYALGEVILEPGTGKVKAMAINRTYSIEPNPGGRKYPNTTNPLLSGSETSPGFQAGSTFKMATMVAALEQGMPLNIKIRAPQKYTSKYTTSAGSAACPLGGDRFSYCPSNATPAMTGTHTMWSAFSESVNTFFVQLQEDVGVKAAVAAAEKLGIRFRAEVDLANKANPDAWGSFTLGTAQVSALDMANAYATVAARGKHCEPTPVLKITDSAGKELPYSKPKCSQVIPKEVADAANDAAKCPVGGKATGDCVNSASGATAPDVTAALGRPVMGKTGTTNSNNSASFIGSTPNLAAAVFKVNPDAPNTSVGETRSPKEVFKASMSAALKDLPVENFTSPESKRAQGELAMVPRLLNSNPESAKATIERAGFRAEIASEEVASSAREGRVARTTPDGGERVPKGSTVTIYVSSGEAPPAASSPSPPTAPSQPAAPQAPDQGVVPGDRANRPRFPGGHRRPGDSN
jgi:membrane peptidoglycan carboxypeptidase